MDDPPLGNVQHRLFTLPTVITTMLSTEANPGLMSFFSASPPLALEEKTQALALEVLTAMA
jgi:hypothetical protein